MASVLSTEVSQGYCDWVFSTIQRHLRTWKPLGRIFSQSITASLGAQTPRRPLQGCSTISTSQPSVALTHSTKPPFLYATHGPNELEPREATLERPEQLFATVMILDIGLMHQHL